MPKNTKNLLKSTMAAGVPCIVDASGTLLTSCIDALPTMIKPNTDEIGQLPRKRSNYRRREVIKAAQELHKRSIKIVVVSLGAKGALMVSDEGTFRANPQKKLALSILLVQEIPLLAHLRCTCSEKSQLQSVLPLRCHVLPQVAYLQVPVALIKMLQQKFISRSQSKDC